MYEQNTAGLDYREIAAPDQSSLASIMSNLDEQVKRARSVAAKAEQLCTQVYGPRPQSVGETAKASANSLESLIGSLAIALTDAEMSLNRL